MSQVLSGYRELGIVSDGCGLAFEKHGPETTIVASIGKGHQIYSASKLRLLFVATGQQHRGTTLLIHQGRVYVAEKNQVSVWKRGKLLIYLPKHHSERITHMFIFGELLATLDRGGLLVLQHPLPPEEDSRHKAADTKPKPTASSSRKVQRQKTSRADEDEEEGQGPDDSDDEDDEKADQDHNEEDHQSGEENENDEEEEEDEKKKILSWSAEIKQAPVVVFRFPFDLDQLTTVMQPHTYLNKLLIGTKDGRLQLWNVQTQSLVYAFKKASWSSAVLKVEQSPAVDVVAVALANGDIHLINLRFDQVLFSFRLEHSPPVSLSFRTDGPPILAAGSEDGQIAIFDLKQKILLSMMPQAHRSRVSTLRFLPGEPIMVTSSPDNSIKMWIFDRQNGSGCRLLRQRAGHTFPPTFIRFYGGLNSEYLLSAGRDSSFRLFNTILDHQNVEFSQGSTRKQRQKQAKSEGVWTIDGSTSVSVLQPIRRFAFSQVREREWDNIVTCHLRDRYVYTWNYENCVIGSHRVCSTEPGQPSYPHSVAVSACGNFFFLGTERGWIDKFNIQSGLHRGCYLSPASKKTESGGSSSSSSSSSSRGGRGGSKGRKYQVDTSPAHSKTVTGLACDPLNRYLISSSLDGFVKLWDFNKRNLVASVNVGSPITMMEVFATIGGVLVATASDDLSVRIIDMETKRVVRRFSGHSNQITDLAFSPDGRWLVSASMDETLRVWDVPTASMIDWARFSKAVTSLAFSPTGDFLVTTHADSLGLCMWSNRDHFATVFLKKPGPEPPLLVLQKKASDQLTLDDNEEEEDESSTSSSSSSSTSSSSSSSSSSSGQSVAPLAPQLITLSGIASETHWKHLSELETIKAHNKPKEPPKAPEQAPFFLPARSGLEPEWDVEADKKDGEDDSGRSRIRRFGDLVDLESPLVKLVREVTSEAKPWDVSRVIHYLAKKGPSQVDLEFRAISAVDESIFELFLDFFLELFEQSEGSFELGQSYLNLFLRLYSEDILHYPALSPKLAQLKQAQEASWLRIEKMFQTTLCLVEYFSGLV